MNAPPRIYPLALSFCLLALMSGCRTHPNKHTNSMKAIDLQGHRGARGLMPENTIAGFIRALELGVNTLEMDVVVSGDQQLILSHEPWFSHQICLDSLGHEISEDTEKEWRIYEMTTGEIRQFDCGSREHPRFPAQKHFPAAKPTLKEVIRAVENYVQEQGLPPVDYNIETKSKPEWDGIFTPPPEEFVRLLYNTIREEGIGSRAIVQSFDPRTLRHMRAVDSSIRLAWLVWEDRPIDEHINELGFIPHIYSPDFHILSAERVAAAHKQGMKVIPWTINDTVDMERVLAMGVDGLITDYPGRAGKVIQTYRKANP